MGSLCTLLGQSSSALFLLSSLLGRKEKKKVVFMMAFDYFNNSNGKGVNTVASFSLPVCNCSFMTLEFHAECRFSESGPLPGSCRPSPFQILSRVPDGLPEML